MISFNDNNIIQNVDENNLIINNNIENQDEIGNFYDNQDNNRYVSLGEPPEFLFSVIKLGKRGFSHKNRLLHISYEGISYYCMVDNNETTKIFLESLKSLYGTRTNDIDRNKLKEVAQNFRQLPDKEKVLKAHFNDYLVEKSEPVSSFNKAPFTVTNKLSNEGIEQNTWIMEAKEVIFRDLILGAKKEIENFFIQNQKREEIENNKQGKKNKQKEEKIKDFGKEDKIVVLNEYKEKIKYIGLIYQGFMKEYLKAICEYSHKKREYYDKMGNSDKRDTGDEERNKFFMDIPNNIRTTAVKNLYNKKNDNDSLMKGSNGEENIGEIDFKEKEINVSNVLAEQINDILKIVYLELAIYYSYDLFVKYCEKVVEKIVYHLGTFDNAEDILKPGKLHPFVFPNPSNFTQITNNNPEKQDDNTEPVLLYSIWGVNYTVTWNNLTAKFGKTVGTSGKWKKIKHQFQQKNYFQDFLIKLASVAKTTENFPDIPVSCLIDYNGFRVYCESDTFTNEEYLEGIRLQLNKNDNSFIKNIIDLICINNNEKSKKIDMTDIYCKITNDYIAKEKNFDLEQYIKTMIEDFLKTFEQKDEGKVVDVKKNENFYEIQSQKPIINSIKKLLTDDRNIMRDTKEHLDDFQKDSIEFQKNFSLHYLLYFDVLIPKEMKTKKNEVVYFRQEIAINNINIKEELKHLAPKYLQREEDEDLYEINNNDIRSEEGLNDSKFSKNSIINNNNNINNNQIKKSNNKIIKLNKEEEKKKSPEEIILDIISKNTYQNNEDIRENLQIKFKQNFDNLLMAFDSLYLIPYNSETLKICFHYYGINLRYLGRVAEKTTVPHIRELCLIEMFARVCKKIIFDLLGQTTYERAMKAFYSNIKELTTKLHCVPVSLNVVYGSDYLKSITQPIERGKCYYKNMEITGLYMNSEEYPLNGVSDDKDKKIINETDFNLMRNQKVNNFLLMLFGGVTKPDLNINGIVIKKTEELWDLIRDLIRKQYNINDEDVFMYCDLETISVYSLVSAIQYHTGLQFQNEISGFLEKVMTQKLENVVFENLTPLPKKSYYSFTYFLCKENVILPLTNNFAMYFPKKPKYYKAKLNYYSEKYLYKKKISQNFYYLKYLKILKKWDIEINPKAGKDDTKIDEFDKKYSPTTYSSYQISSVFEDNFESFIALLMTQFQPKSQRNLHRGDNQDIQNGVIDNNLIFNCIKIISDYWKNEKHPFISILKSTYAKALYKNSKSMKEEPKIVNTYFNDSIKIARDSMGELNLFFGKLCRDVGLFYEKNFKFKEAYEMFYLSYRVFRKYQNIFKKDYFYSLKNLTKTCVFLGRLNECLQYGIIIVEEITKDNNKDLSDPLKLKDSESLLGEEKKKCAWDKIHNMDGFTFNLMKVAKYLHEYDLGVKIGNIFFSRIKDYKTFKIPQFKHWLNTSQERIKNMSVLRNTQNNKDIKPNRQIRIEEEAGKDKRIDSVSKCYLKCLFRGLKGTENKIYSRAYVSFIENCYNEELSKLSNEKIDELFYGMFLGNINETFDQYFKNKILYFLFQKYKKENLNKEEVEQMYNSARKDLELIYYKFKKKPKKLFLSNNL